MTGLGVRLRTSAMYTHEINKVYSDITYASNTFFCLFSFFTPIIPQNLYSDTTRETPGGPVSLGRLIHICPSAAAAASPHTQTIG